MLKKILIFLLLSTTILWCACERPGDITPPHDNTVVDDDSDITNPYNAENLNAFMKERYETAKEAFFWFTINTIPPEEANIDINAIKEVDGYYYYKTGHPYIKTLADLEAHLKSVFSDEIAQSLLEQGKKRYIDINGRLWAVDASRGTDITVGNAIFSISDKTDTKIIYEAVVEEIDIWTGNVIGINSHKYVYEKTDKGWRWTQFSIYE